MEKNNGTTLVIIQITLSILTVMLSFMLSAILSEIKEKSKSDILVTYKCISNKTNTTITGYKNYTRSEFKTSVLWENIKDDIQKDSNQNMECLIDDILSY